VNSLLACVISYADFSEILHDGALLSGLVTEPLQLTRALWPQGVPGLGIGNPGCGVVKLHHPVRWNTAGGFLSLFSLVLWLSLLE